MSTSTKILGTLPVYRQYTEGTTYYRHNIVTYDGSSYICTVESTTELPTNTEAWSLFAGNGKSQRTVNMSTSYSSDGSVEEMTLDGAVAAVPTEDRTLGFLGTYKDKETGEWYMVQYDGDDLEENSWANVDNWNALSLGNVHVSTVAGYLLAVCDDQENLLGGIKENGEWDIPNGIPAETKVILEDLKQRVSDHEALLTVTDSDSWIFAIQDSEGHILEGYNKEYGWYMNKGIPEDTKKELAKIRATIAQHYSELTTEVADRTAIVRTENVDGYLWVLVDNDDHILMAANPDGSIYQPKGIPEEVKTYLSDAIVTINNQFEEINEKVDNLDGLVFKNEGDPLLVVEDENGNALMEIDRKGCITQGAELSIEDRDGTGIKTKTTSGEKLFSIVDSTGKALLNITSTGVLEQGSDLNVKDINGNGLDVEDKGLETLYSIIDGNGKEVFRIANDGKVTVGNGIVVDSNKSGMNTDSTEGNTLFNVVDANDKVMLALTDTGALVQGNELDITDRSESAGIKVISNSKNSSSYLFAVLDAKGNVLMGVDNKGALFANRLTGALETEVVDNKEFIWAIKDNNGNVICGQKRTGALWVTSVEVDGIPELTEDEEFVYVILDANRKVLWGITNTGRVYSKKGASEETSDRIKKLEETVDEFHSKIADFHGGTGDWSEASSMQVPLPRCAMCNFNVATMPTAKSGMGTSGVNCDIPCDMEFWDMQGNYFKKPVLLSAQGNSSMGFIKKNLAIDIFLTNEDRANDGDTFAIKFGDWVSQDSFHLKAYYTDFFRGVGAVSYQLCEEVAHTRAFNDDRPYKYLFATDPWVSDYGTSKNDELNQNFDTGAKCFPMGFPVIVYQNGEFYGVYAWQMKKHRDNYWQNKKTAEHIQLDGDLYAQNIWQGTVNWTGFEVRNPKSLYMQVYNTIKGVDTLEYNGDYPREIMGKDSEFYDKSDKNMKRCANVKGYIEDLATRIPMIQAKEAEYSYGSSVDNAITYLQNIDSHSTPFTGIVTSCMVAGKTFIFYLDSGNADITNSANYGYKMYLQVNTQVTTIKTNEALAALIADPTYEATLIYNNGAVDTTAVAKVLSDNGLDGYSIVFDGVAGKNYENGDKVIHLQDVVASYPYLRVVTLGNVLTPINAKAVEKTTAMREYISQWFMPEHMIDFLLNANITGNTDEFGKNWQWTTWDGVKWCPNMYDCDMSFGGYFVGDRATAPSSGWLTSSTAIPTGWIIRYWLPEIKARYKELRDLGIYDAKHIANLVKDWCDRIGYDNWEKEYEKWPESPCNRDSLINTDYWDAGTYIGVSAYVAITTYNVGSIVQYNGKTWKSLVASNVGNTPEEGEYWTDITWNDTTQYTAGEYTYYKGYRFKAVQDSVDEMPLTGTYTYYPQVFGHRDSIYRVYNWLVKRVGYLDTLLGYSAS